MFLHGFHAQLVDQLLDLRDPYRDWTDETHQWSGHLCSLGVQIKKPYETTTQQTLDEEMFHLRKRTAQCYM